MKEYYFNPCRSCYEQPNLRHGSTIEGYWVECRDCGEFTEIYDTEDESVEAWNNEEY